MGPNNVLNYQSHRDSVKDACWLVAVQYFLHRGCTRCPTVIQRGCGYSRQPRPSEGTTGRSGDGTEVFPARSVEDAVRQ